MQLNHVINISPGFEETSMLIFKWLCQFAFLSAVNKHTHFPTPKPESAIISFFLFSSHLSSLLYLILFLLHPFFFLPFLLSMLILIFFFLFLIVLYCFLVASIYVNITGSQKSKELKSFNCWEKIHTNNYTFRSLS